MKRSANKPVIIIDKLDYFFLKGIKSIKVRCQTWLLEVAWFNPIND